MSVVHRTYSEFDVRAITIQGLSAKPAAPGEKPIGKFGTGLKYAIAVLIREGCSVTIMTPGQRHKIVGHTGTFRGNDYEGLLMRSWDTTKAARPKRTELPFTTHYGSNWEMWMALRELHSNTLDEGGWSKLFNNHIPDEHMNVSEGCAIIIEGEAYEKEYYKLGQVFLHAGDQTVIPSDNVKVYELPHDDYISELRYYRSLRAGDLPENLMFKYIYDVTTECYLSEERQVNVWQWEWAVIQAVARSTDTDFIKTVLEAEDDFWESTIRFNESMDFSEEFLNAASYAKVRAEHWKTIESKKPKSIEQLNIEEFPTPWRINSYAIVADNGNMVATKPANMSEGDWKAVWKDRLAAVNEHAPSILPSEAPEALVAPAQAAEERDKLILPTDDFMEMPF